MAKKTQNDEKKESEVNILFKKMGRPKVYTPEFVQELVDDLNEWASREDSIIFREWAANKMIPYTTIAELSVRFPDFSEALKIAKMKVGCRREKKGLLGELDSGIIRKTMGVYDPDYYNYEIATKESNAKALGKAVAENITIEVYDSKKKEELINGSKSTL